MAVNVGAMLVFIALIAMLNGILAALGSGVDSIAGLLPTPPTINCLLNYLGYLFAP